MRFAFAESHYIYIINTVKHVTQAYARYFHTYSYTYTNTYTHIHVHIIHISILAGINRHPFLSLTDTVK